MGPQRVIGGATRVAAILGHPVAASRSPAMHNAAFAAVELDWRYVAFDVEPEQVNAAIRGAAALGLAGLNITAPHKAAAATAVDRLEGIAAQLELVNTICFDGATLVGYSTDGEGFLDSARDHGCVVSHGTRAVILGAGGAGVSVAAALLAEGAEVALLNRSPDRLAAAVELLGRATGVAGSDNGRRLRGHGLGEDMIGAANEALAAAELVVQCIPPSVALPELAFERVDAGACACDLAYAPSVTPFMRAVDKRANRIWNGLGMLVYQGARSFSLWTGAEAPVGVMAAAVGYRSAD